MFALLRNLGPKSEFMLREAGINTVEELRALGAVKAYALVKRSGVKASLNLLWALEGALSDRPWQDVAKSDRLSLLLLLEQEQESKPGIAGKKISARHGTGSPKKRGTP